MALITLSRRRQVTLWFGFSPTSRLVTRIADAFGAGVVNPCPADESDCGMTRPTIQAGGQMAAIFWQCFRHLRIAVTAVAPRGWSQCCVVDSSSFEITSDVTITTILAGLDMSLVLTQGNDPVMTQSAVIDNTGMVKGRRNKTGSIVTLAAIIVGRHMVLLLTQGDSAVMANGTISGHAQMIELGSGKGRGVVTDGTIVTGNDVILGFDRSGGIRTIVALNTIADDIAMIEHRRGEAAGHMTDTAILIGGDMTDVFLSKGTYAVSVLIGSGCTVTMTFIAIVDASGVVKNEDLLEI